MIVAIWVVAALLLALWTLLSWGLATLLSLDGSWVGQVEPWLSRLPFGGWLEGWFPEWLTVAQTLLEWLQAALSWLGAAAPVLVWLTWGAGAFVLVVLAAVLTLVVAMVRKHSPGAGSGRPAAAT